MVSLSRCEKLMAASTENAVASARGRCGRSPDDDVACVAMLGSAPGPSRSREDPFYQRDYVYFAWSRKAIAFISWGGSGGTRSVEQLRLVAIELDLAPTRFAVH